MLRWGEKGEKGSGEEALGRRVQWLREGSSPWGGTLQYQGGWGLQSREHGFLAPHLPPPPAGSHSLFRHPGPAPPPCTRRLRCHGLRCPRCAAGRGERGQAALELGGLIPHLHSWGHSVPVPCDRTNGQTPLAGIEGTGQEGRGPLLGTDFRELGHPENTRSLGQREDPEECLRSYSREKDLTACGRMSPLYPHPQRVPRDKHFRCPIKPFLPI